MCMLALFWLQLKDLLGGGQGDKVVNFTKSLSLTSSFVVLGILYN